MPVVKDIDSSVFPMPSRIEISFKETVGETSVPDITKPIIKYFFQDYDMSTNKSVGANIIQIKGSYLEGNDFENVMSIFIKYFDNAYKEKYKI